MNDKRIKHHTELLLNDLKLTDKISRALIKGAFRHAFEREHNRIIEIIETASNKSDYAPVQVWAFETIKQIKEMEGG